MIYFKSRLGVAQMVARYLGVVEAAGSNPVTQTRLDLKRYTLQVFVFILNLRLRFERATYLETPRSDTPGEFLS